MGADLQIHIIPNSPYVVEHIGLTEEAEQCRDTRDSISRELYKQFEVFRQFRCDSPVPYELIELNQLLINCLKVVEDQEDRLEIEDQLNKAWETTKNLIKDYKIARKGICFESTFETVTLTEDHLKAFSSSTLGSSDFKWPNHEEYIEMIKSDDELEEFIKEIALQNGINTDDLNTYTLDIKDLTKFFSDLSITDLTSSDNPYGFDLVNEVEALVAKSSEKEQNESYREAVRLYIKAKDSLEVLKAAEELTEEATWRTNCADQKEHSWLRDVILATPSVWVGEVSWLKAALFNDEETYIPDLVGEINWLIEEPSTLIDDDLIEKIKVIDQNSKNTTGYSVSNIDSIIEFLEEHKGKRCFTVSW